MSMSDFHGCFMSKNRTMFKFLASAGFLFMYVNMIRDDMRDLYIYIYTYSFGNVYAYTSVSRYMHEFIYIYIYIYVSVY